MKNSRLVFMLVGLFVILSFMGCSSDSGGDNQNRTMVTLTKANIPPDMDALMLVSGGANASSYESQISNNDIILSNVLYSRAVNGDSEEVTFQSDIGDVRILVAHISNIGGDLVFIVSGDGNGRVGIGYNMSGEEVRLEHYAYIMNVRTGAIYTSRIIQSIPTPYVESLTTLPNLIYVVNYGTLMILNLETETYQSLNDASIVRINNGILLPDGKFVAEHNGGEVFGFGDSWVYGDGNPYRVTPNLGLNGIYTTSLRPFRCENTQDLCVFSIMGGNVQSRKVYVEGRELKSDVIYEDSFDLGDNIASINNININPSPNNFRPLGYMHPTNTIYTYGSKGFLRLLSNGNFEFKTWAGASIPTQMSVSPQKVLANDKGLVWISDNYTSISYINFQEGATTEVCSGIDMYGDNILHFGDDIMFYTYSGTSISTNVLNLSTCEVQPLSSSTLDSGTIIRIN
jgi:hypothetical protein